MSHMQVDRDDEEWGHIQNYTNYQISNHGRVKNDKTNRILKNQIDNLGYEIIQLRNDNLSKSHRIHNLVANVFIPNPENKPCIDHIDNDKQNNNVNNLRWATKSENQHNRKLSCNNASGFKGVHLNIKSNKWISTISINGQRFYLGSYDVLRDARDARCDVAESEFGEFICGTDLNRPFDLNINLTPLDNESSRD